MHFFYPGDPAYEVLSQGGFSEPTQEQVEQMRELLGLNQPLYVQYMSWFGQMLQGDLGTSYMTGKSVSAELIHRLPITLSLSVVAMLFTLIMGVPLGVLMSMKSQTYWDHGGRIVALVLTSIPGFWLAILLMTLFAERLGWLPTSGWGTWQHVLMPAFVLACGTMGIMMRLTRAAMLEIQQQNYMLTATAKGLHPFFVTSKHGLRNALIPVLTLSGVFFGNILAGAVIVEVIFSIPGIGRFAVNGIFARDFPVIQGYVMFSGGVFVLANLIVDLLYVWIQPQIRLGVKVS